MQLYQQRAKLDALGKAIKSLQQQSKTAKADLAVACAAQEKPSEAAPKLADAADLLGTRNMSSSGMLAITNNVYGTSHHSAKSRMITKHAVICLYHWIARGTSFLSTSTTPTGSRAGDARLEEVP